MVSRVFAEEHYAIHKGKPFYEPLINFITSAPVMAMVWEGQRLYRQYAKPWEPLAHWKQHPVQYATIMHYKCVIILLMHPTLQKNARREIEMWFKPEELVNWQRSLDSWYFD